MRLKSVFHIAVGWLIPEVLFFNFRPLDWTDNSSKKILKFFIFYTVVYNLKCVYNI